MNERALWLGVAASFLIAACKPSSIADAEAKGDVAWLDNEGSAAAVLAMGRLADTNPEAANVLKARAAFDVTAFIAAWTGVKRGAKWGSDLLHDGLQDPARAELAASAMEGRDPKAAPFVSDVEAAMTRLAAGGATSTLAGVLAAVGQPAHDAITRRLADKTTRGAMCGGISSPAASDDARATLRAVAPTSRDDAACVGTVMTMASTDDVTLRWLAQVAEPGLLSAAGRLPTIECPRLQRLWTDTLASRGGAQAGALTVPLSLAVKRCPAVMDGILADAIKTKPDTQVAVLGAIDPFSADDAALKATCATLPLVARGRASAIVKERATDALAHGCKATP